MSNYSTSFRSFTSQSQSQKSYVGLGNPNAYILFVGKESAHVEEGNSFYNNNANSWAEHIVADKLPVMNYKVNETHELRKGWGSNTWSKYQKLNDLIFNRNSPQFEVNFLQDVFATEMNDNPSKNTSTASKSGMNERKEFFKESDFIQGFPVVVLACSDYVVTHAGPNEIVEMFGVEYDEQKSDLEGYSQGNWFGAHYNEDRSKLVVHTRQLSTNVDNQLLEDIAACIREQLIRLNLLPSH